MGISHTRWATHGGVTENNAHPHRGMKRKVAVVHNGIIENHDDLRDEQVANGFVFTSETDTEVVAHEVAHQRNQTDSLLSAVQKTITKLEGAYGLAVLEKGNEDEMQIRRVTRFRRVEFPNVLLLQHKSNATPLD